VGWVISPGIRINTGNFLRFKAGQFSVGGTAPAQFDIDDSISVMVSTNCGTTWKKIFKIGAFGINFVFFCPYNSLTLQSFILGLLFTNQYGVFTILLTSSNRAQCYQKILLQ